MTDIELKKSLFEAFVKAIETVGIENFKKCSFFGSNDKVKNAIILGL